MRWSYQGDRRNDEEPRRPEGTAQVSSEKNEPDMPPPPRDQQPPWISGAQTWEAAARVVRLHWEHRQNFRAAHIDSFRPLPIIAADQPSPPPSVGLVLKYIIIPGGKTDEGTLVKAVAPPWFEIIKYLSEDWNRAYEMPPRQWEEIIAGAYAQAGFDNVTLTPRSGDHGRDVIAVKKGIGEVRVIDQVKAYKPSLLVDADAVRAVMGVLQTDGAAKGFVTTTSDFAPGIRTDPLISPLIPSRLGLINGQELLQRLQELASKRT
jgi:restriction system protein